MSNNKVNWNIQVERGSYDEDGYFESQIRFTDDDELSSLNRLRRFVGYLIEEGVISDSYDEDDTNWSEDEDEDYDSDED
jgi:hypothetical protein